MFRRPLIVPCPAKSVRPSAALLLLSHAAAAGNAGGARAYVRGDLEGNAPRAVDYRERRRLIEAKQKARQATRKKLSRLTDLGDAFRRPMDPKAGAKDLSGGPPASLVSETRRLAVMEDVHRIEASQQSSQPMYDPNAASSSTLALESMAGEEDVVNAAFLTAVDNGGNDEDVRATRDVSAASHQSAAPPHTPDDVGDDAYVEVVLDDDEDDGGNPSDHQRQQPQQHQQQVLVMPGAMRAAVVGEEDDDGEGATVEEQWQKPAGAPKRPILAHVTENLREVAATVAQQTNHGSQADELETGIRSATERCLDNLPSELVEQAAGRSSSSALPLAMCVVACRAVASKATPALHQTIAMARLAELLCRFADDAATAVESSSGDGPVPELHVELAASLAAAVSTWASRRRVDVELFRRASSLIAAVAQAAISRGCMIDLQSIDAAYRAASWRKVLVPMVGESSHAVVVPTRFDAVLKLPWFQRPRHAIAFASACQLVRLADACFDAARASWASGQLESLPFHVTSDALLAAMERILLLDGARFVVVSHDDASHTAVVRNLPPTDQLLKTNKVPIECVWKLLLDSRPSSSQRVKNVTTMSSLLNHLVVALRSASARDNGDVEVRMPALSSFFLGAVARSATTCSSFSASSSSSTSPTLHDSAVAKIMTVLSYTKCTWSGTRTFVRLAGEYFFGITSNSTSSSSVGDPGASDVSSPQRASHVAMPLAELTPSSALRVVACLSNLGVRIPVDQVKGAKAIVREWRHRGKVSLDVLHKFDAHLARLHATQIDSAWLMKLRKRNAAAKAAAATQNAERSDMDDALATVHHRQPSGMGGVSPTSSFSSLRLTRADPFEAWGLEVDEDLRCALRDDRGPAARAFMQTRHPVTGGPLKPGACVVLAVDGIAVTSPEQLRQAMFGALSVGLHVAVDAASDDAE